MTDQRRRYPKPSASFVYSTLLVGVLTVLSVWKPAIMINELRLELKLVSSSVIPMVSSSSNSSTVLHRQEPPLNLTSASIITTAESNQQPTTTALSLNLLSNRSRDKALLEYFRYAQVGEDSQLSHSDNRCLSTLPVHRNYSAVVFEGHLGLGHRLSHMAATANIAWRLNSALFAHFRCCGNQEIFSHYFGTEPFFEPVQKDQQPPFLWQFQDNEINKMLLKSTDICTQDASQQKFQTDYLFYSELLQRFRYQDVLDEFRQHHSMDEHLVIGLHIRAGNGERGDFVRKNRGIHDMTAFLDRLVESLRELVSQQGDSMDPPLLFVATDTASMVDDLRQRLDKDMPVISFPQDSFRPSQGSGIQSFWKVHQFESEQDCWNQWTPVLVDHLLLASADVVVAAKASSFVHATPLSIVLGRDPSQRRVPKPFCEVSHAHVDLFSNKDARRPADAAITNQTLLCFDSMTNWCLERKHEGRYPPMIFFLKHDQQQLRAAQRKERARLDAEGNQEDKTRHT